MRCVLPGNTDETAEEATVPCTAESRSCIQQWDTEITHKQSGKAGKYQGSCENRIQVHEIRAADADTYRLHTEGI